MTESVKRLVDARGLGEQGRLGRVGGSLLRAALCTGGLSYFREPTKGTTLRVNLDANAGLWGMMWGCWLLSCSEFLWWGYW